MKEIIQHRVIKKENTIKFVITQIYFITFQEN